MRFFSFLGKGGTNGLANNRREGEVALLRARVSSFLDLLAENRTAHRLIADLEDKAGGDYVFDQAYLRQSVQGLQDAVNAMLQHLDSLAPGKYSQTAEVAHALFSDIHGELERASPPRQDLTSPINSIRARHEAAAGRRRLLSALQAESQRGSLQNAGDFVLPFSLIRAEHKDAVGGKNLRLAQMLNEVGVPVPCGFAITARAYLYFLSHHALGPQIVARLGRIDPLSPGDVAAVSRDLQALIRAHEVPRELSDAIASSYRRLCREQAWHGGIVPASSDREWRGGIVLRSSALREDSAASFAGQYATTLNVAEEHLVDEYREVIASKFSTRAIFYFLTKGFREEDLAMSVACQILVPAVASGVVYSVDPLSPESGCLVINAAWGLGQLVVEGGVTPDVYYLDRRDLRLVRSEVACKARQLAPAPEGGVREVDVPAEKQCLPSLTPEQLRTVGDYALRLEKHFGRPQDIEWAVDPDGNLQVLQSRSLRVLRRTAPIYRELPQVGGHAVLLKEGRVASAGAGSGPVVVVRTDEDLLSFPEGGVLVAAHPSPQLVVALRRAAAIVCDTGGVASHLATLAREFKVPALMATVRATAVLSPGQVVTVDTDRCCVFAGKVTDLLAAEPTLGDDGDLDDSEILQLFRRLLPRIVPLRLVDPQRANFSVANCESVHDLTRFVHQMAMNEMVCLAERLSDEGWQATRLEADIPLAIQVLDVSAETPRGSKSLRPEQITSLPLREFLRGLAERPWPGPRSVSLGGFMSVMAIHASEPHRLAEPCLVIASERYMNFSVRTGYHYSTVEALCPEMGGVGFVRFHFRGGGAAAECRERRERLLHELLVWSGFAVDCGPEMISAIAEHLTEAAVLRRVRLLAYLTVYTKQLDVLLTDDAVTSWYIEEFKKGAEV
ncbi:MAG: PEP-utilizing enzyme [Chloroflexi bacterium]|nr:PEP-utilizing enzyme [Chloroflexota bacterium]